MGAWGAWHTAALGRTGVKKMAMPSFFGSVVEAMREGATTEKCRYCGAWVWVWPDRTSKPGEAWCPTRACEGREAARRDGERSPEERASRAAATAEYVAGRMSWEEYCAKVPA